MNMKKVIAAAAAFVLAAGLACRAPSNFGVSVNEDLNVEVAGENGNKGDYGMTATLTVEEGQGIIVDSEITSGSVKVSLYGQTGGEDSESIPEADTEKAVLEFEVSESGQAKYDVAPGEYFVKAEVLEKFTGKAVITAK